MRLKNLSLIISFLFLPILFSGCGLFNCPKWTCTETGTDCSLNANICSQEKNISNNCSTVKVCSYSSASYNATGGTDITYNAITCSQNSDCPQPQNQDLCVPKRFCGLTNTDCSQDDNICTQQIKNQNTCIPANSDIAGWHCSLTNRDCTSITDGSSPNPDACQTSSAFGQNRCFHSDYCSQSKGPCDATGATPANPKICNEIPPNRCQSSMRCSADLTSCHSSNDCLPVNPDSGNTCKMSGSENTVQALVCANPKSGGTSNMLVGVENVYNISGANPFDQSNPTGLKNTSGIATYNSSSTSSSSTSSGSTSSGSTSSGSSSGSGSTTCDGTHSGTCSAGYTCVHPNGLYFCQATCDGIYSGICPSGQSCIKDGLGRYFCD